MKTPKITEDEVFEALDWFVWRTLSEVTDLVGKKRSVHEDENFITDEIVCAVLGTLILKDRAEKREYLLGEYVEVEYRRRNTQSKISPIVHQAEEQQRLAA